MTRYGCAAAAITSSRSSCLYVRHLQQIIRQHCQVQNSQYRSPSLEAHMQACGRAYALDGITANVSFDVVGCTLGAQSNGLGKHSGIGC